MSTHPIPEQELLAAIAAHSAWLTTYHATTCVSKQLVLLESAIGDVQLSGKTLQSVEIVRCDWYNVSFYQCDLSHSILIDNTFHNCSFINCLFVKTDFRGSHCRSVNFSGSAFTRSDFTESDLSYANLTACRMDWTWLVRCDLRYAILDQVNLEGARIIEAKLYNDKKFTLQNLKQIVVQAVDVSPDGDGSHIVNDVNRTFLLDHNT